MKLKSGKEEVSYLLKKVFEKYEAESGEQVVRNTNRKNYESISKKLSNISNELPATAEKYGHEPYPPDHNPNHLEYPYRKYDITASQVKDAYMGLVNSPRPFLIDACYIYLYDKGRKAFGNDVTDENLLSGAAPIAENNNLAEQGYENVKRELAELKEEKEVLQKIKSGRHKKLKRNFVFLLAATMAGLLFTGYQWLTIKRDWAEKKKDLNILSYKPAAAEVDSLQGVWLCYVGSPQARISNPNRYHMVAPNLIDIKYKNGYFTFNRYGSNFDHAGYMQFEAPWLVSIHSYVKNNSDSIQSPRHSLMRLDKEKQFIPVISASWNFDAGSRNDVIGIREVYSKQGSGGSMEEIINTTENASCGCKIVQWRRDGMATKTFYLRNELLDTLADENLKKLIDEKSILLRTPQRGLLLGADSVSENEKSQK